MRVKPYIAEQESVEERITPAHAGKTFFIDYDEND